MSLVFFKLHVGQLILPQQILFLIPSAPTCFIDSPHSVRWTVCLTKYLTAFTPLHFGSHIVIVNFILKLIKYCDALLGNGLVNMFQHATMGGVPSVDECYSSLLGSTTILATVGEGCFLCGLRHATAEMCFLRCPCRVYITRVRL
jgi:hypothetical protein